VFRQIVVTAFLILFIKEAFPVGLLVFVAFDDFDNSYDFPIPREIIASTQERACAGSNSMDQLIGELDRSHLVDLFSVQHPPNDEFSFGVRIPEDDLIHEDDDRPLPVPDDLSALIH